MVRTFALTIAYDGTRYAGWQRQENAVSIQSRLEEAVFRAVGQTTPVVASGRTDSGVHAIGQVARLELEGWRHAAGRLVPSLNSKLPNDIVVRSACEAQAGFDPVRHAIGKRYRYTIRAAPCPDPLAGRYHWYFPRPLDLDMMREGAQRLVGCHDFAAFQSAGSRRKTTVRTVRELSIVSQPALDGHDVIMEIEADGFLYNMVRNIVGSLVEIGTGRFSPRWLDGVVQGRDRRLAGQTAPPHGLCLLSVAYPVHCFMEG